MPKADLPRELPGIGNDGVTVTSTDYPGPPHGTPVTV